MKTYYRGVCIEMAEEELKRMKDEGEDIQAFFSDILDAIDEAFDTIGFVEGSHIIIDDGTRDLQDDEEEIGYIDGDQVQIYSNAPTSRLKH